MNVLSRLCPTLLLMSTCLCAEGVARAAVDDEVRATFERFVQAQNAHDAKALEGLLVDSAGFLWITRGAVIWGRDGALQQFTKLYAGTWRLDPDLEPQLPTLPFCPDEVSSSHTLQGIPYWLLSVEKTPDLLCSESFRVFSKQGEDRLTHGPR